MKKVPKIYEKVINKMYMNSFEGKLHTWKARRILGVIFHINKHDIISILKEMEEYKLVKFPKNAGGRYIFIIWTPGLLENGEGE